jgi:DNA topoisomerase-1
VVKEGKYPRPTILGVVITNLMKERFPDIVDMSFTATMESRLDEVEEGKCEWKNVLADFYDGFSKELSDAETALEGERIKIPAEVTEEKCDVCGQFMVVKSGRFGRFLACPGFPECTFTKPLVIEMPGKCPRCGSRILKRTSKKGYTYYACERGAECGFMTWDVPTKDYCPDCGKTLFKRSGKGRNKPYCINEECVSFVPEDKRGYKKKAATEEGAEAPAEAATEAAEESVKKTAKKTTTKKAAEKKTTKKTTKSASKKKAEE